MRCAPFDSLQRRWPTQSLKASRCSKRAEPKWERQAMRLRRSQQARKRLAVNGQSAASVESDVIVAVEGAAGIVAAVVARLTCHPERLRCLNRSRLLHLILPLLLLRAQAWPQQ